MGEMKEESLYQAIGDNIRRFRTLINLSQTRLASQVKLSRTSIVNIEQGNQHASVYLLWRIAECLGVSLHRLLPDQIDSITDTSSARGVSALKTAINEEAYNRVSDLINRANHESKKAKSD